MIPTEIITEFLSEHQWQSALFIGCAVTLAVLVLNRDSVSQRRHRRYQKKAARALSRLPQLRDDAARVAWLRKMNPYVFEEMLLTAFSRQGFRIRRNSRYSGDGGMDGQVWINGQRWLLQAKRYSATISATDVSAFGQLAKHERCQGLFVHTGRTGEVSREAFRRYDGITLISGQRLLLLLRGDRRWMDRLNSPTSRFSHRNEQPPSPIALR